MEYKTLRYPGHAKIMEAIRDLGLLEQDPIEVNGLKVSPRAVAVAAMGPRLTMPDSADLVALRVIVSGTKDGKPKTFEWDLVDRYNPATGISAMERTTGYSLAITGLMQVRGQVKALGVRTPDEAMPAKPYIDALRARGVNITETER